MVFGFFRTTDVLKFADSVVADYDQLRRSAAVRMDSPAKRLQRFEKLAQRIDAYCREERLNFYKKSKMLFAIEQGLQQKAVAQDQITEFLDNLLAKGLRR